MFLKRHREDRHSHILVCILDSHSCKSTKYVHTNKSSFARDLEVQNITFTQFVSNDLEDLITKSLPHLQTVDIRYSPKKSVVGFI